MITQEVMRVSWKALEEYAFKVLRQAGLSEEQARIVADTLTQANLRGVDTHNVGLLPSYWQQLKDGSINPRPTVRVVKESSAALLVDGDGGPGQVASVFAMEKAIDKAREVGIGWAQVFNSNHHGALAYYAIMAAREDMVGIVTTNTGPSMAPWGGRAQVIGNNPLAIAAPVKGRLPLVLDIAMSVKAGGQLRLAQEQGTLLPEGMAIDKEGNPTRDWRAARDGSLLPFGAYKGSSLAMMLEIIAAVMSGSPHLSQVAQKQPDNKGNKAHALAALNPAFFTDPEQFKEDTADIVRQFKECPLRPGFKEIVVPGEIEWNTAAEREHNGIPIPHGALESLRRLGKEAAVPFPA